MTQDERALGALQAKVEALLTTVHSLDAKLDKLTGDTASRSDVIDLQKQVTSLAMESGLTKQRLSLVWSIIAALGLTILGLVAKVLGGEFGA